MIQKTVHICAITVLALGILVSIVLGMLISRKITTPINRLVEGTRRIFNGDLLYQVKLDGRDDEINELAKSFNLMAKGLYKSKKKLLNYFYRIVESFVRILEARDHYTKGHSERVAAYAQEIALEMGLPEDKIEILKEAALLHDIGKLGIKEETLNKKEKLTEEEWEVIRKHPVIGGEILKPVLLTEEMLAIVRGHHERYDSNGYPDNLSGEKINIFAAIVSVADAYDAMISPRAYRAAFSKEEAIKELVSNSGTQFNPRVVEAFLRVLNREKTGKPF
jgi:putative nucleotidyltransferase with HDIG domain